MYTVVTPERFLRASGRFFRQHPDLLPRFRQVVVQLRDDPYHPRLRLHAFKGHLAGMHAVSLTYEYRVTLTLKLSEREIILLDIGGHHSVYR
jgi:mRNA-degrading endonuclease YafQ of YafQ-DinJ toxin-antitoxin module